MEQKFIDYFNLANESVVTRLAVEKQSENLKYEKISFLVRHFIRFNN